MIEQLAEALKPLLLECAEEQLDTMAETVAKELLSRADIDFDQEKMELK